MVSDNSGGEVTLGETAGDCEGLRRRRWRSQQGLADTVPPGLFRVVRKAGLEGRMPRIVACGGRLRAYESFRISHENAIQDVFPILLVDSEAPVIGNPWEHVRLR